MILFAFYLLKVTTLSGVLFGYYLVALRNRSFHRLNRFYLLAVTALSLVAPLCEWHIVRPATEALPASIRAFQGVSAAGDMTAAGRQDIYAWMLYGSVCAFFLLRLVRSLIRIRKIVRQGTLLRECNYTLVNATVPGTPFSFLRYIFWNPALDPESETGRQVLRHEQVHVEERHSIDKLLLQTILVFFWCNPFFWLIRKELDDVHEFLADRKAVETGGAAALAAMILQAAYPGTYHELTHPFFQSSIKRRLTMLTKNHHPHHFSRLLALPFLGITCLAFTLKLKTETTDVTFNRGFSEMHPVEPYAAVANAQKEDLPLVFIDGKEIGTTDDFVKKVKKPWSFQSVTHLSGDRTHHPEKRAQTRFEFTANSAMVIAGDGARKKYGEKGKNGVFEFTSLEESPSPEKPMRVLVTP